MNNSPPKAPEPYILDETFSGLFKPCYQTNYFSNGQIAGYDFTEKDVRYYLDYFNEDNIILVNSPLVIKHPLLFKAKVKMQRIIFYFKRQFAKRKYIRTYDYIKWSKR